MKSTANLGLNLYEATDYVLHDSFNSDNQKLDAAVMAAVRTPGVIPVPPEHAEQRVTLSFTLSASR